MMDITYRPVTEALEERALESAVFGEFFGNTAAQLQAEYGKYEPASIFLGCWDGAALLGCMRVTRVGTGSSKTLDDLAGPPWSVDVAETLAAARVNTLLTCDIATLSISPAARRGNGGRAADHLFAALFAWSRGAGIRYWTALLDDVVLGLLAAGGIEFQRLPATQSAPYLGSPATSPVYAVVDEVLAALVRSHPRRLAELAPLAGVAV